jgi:flavorubredoxin
MDGESFDAGDRTLLAMRPPVYDSPTTRGLYDPTTEVYWAVDSFATPVPDPAMAVADLDVEFWNSSLALFALGAVSPWLSMVDPVKFGACVDRTQKLDIATIASCHSPVIEGPFIEKAFQRIRELPLLEPMMLPDQSVLDQIIEATSLPQSGR